jgi:hypothetical protein
MVDGENKSGMKQEAIILAFFSLICLITAFVFNMRQGQVHTFKFKLSTDGTTAPQRFEVERDNQVYLVKFSQSVRSLRENKDWVNADIAIETEDGQVITSFGGDFWRASGYDEGPWSETKNQNYMNTTIRHKGIYFLDVELSSNLSQLNAELSVQLIPKRASSLPFIALGVAALIIAIVIGYFEQKSRQDRLLSDRLYEKHLDDQY